MTRDDARVQRLREELLEARHEMARARAWSRAWKAAAVWRFHTGHHKSRAWHMRRRP